MASSSTPAVFQGCRVPVEVLAELLKGSGLQTILNARAAAWQLVLPASSHVKGLAAEDGHLPLRAWSSFPEATRLHVTWSDHGLSSGSNSHTAWHEKLQRLLPTIPSSVKSMSVDPPSGSLKLHADTHLLARALLSAAFKNTLQELSLLPPISTAAADMILQAFPSLQHVTISVFHEANRQAPGKQHCGLPASLLQASGSSGHWMPPEARTWKPPAQVSQLASCTIKGTKDHPTVQETGIDISPFAKATKLASFSISDMFIANWMAIMLLEDLTELRDLSLPVQCCAGQWCILGGLPNLESVHLSDIAACRLPLSSSLTSISTSQGGILVIVHPSSIFSMDCPALQVVDVGTADMLTLAMALQGHTAVRRLAARLVNDHQGADEWGDDDGDDEDAEWPGGLFSSMAALEELVLVEPPCLLSGLMQDVAGCSKLSRLRLELGDVGSAGVASAVAELAALAAGPCSKSLQRLEVVVRSWRGDRATGVVQVKEGDWGQAKVLQVDVHATSSALGMRGEVSSQSLPQALRQQAAKGGWQVTECKAGSVSGSIRSIECSMELRR